MAVGLYQALSKSRAAIGKPLAGALPDFSIATHMALKGFHAFAHRHSRKQMGRHSCGSALRACLALAELVVDV